MFLMHAFGVFCFNRFFCLRISFKASSLLAPLVFSVQMIFRGSFRPFSEEQTH